MDNYTPQTAKLLTTGEPLLLRGLNTDDLSRLVQLFGEQLESLFDPAPDWRRIIDTSPAFGAAVIACGQSTPDERESAADLPIRTQVDALTLIHWMTFTEADFALPDDARRTVDQALRRDGNAPDEPRYLTVYRGCRRDVSLLLAAGHGSANRYPLATLWTEAALVRQRHARRLALDTAVMQACIGSIISKEGGKQLRSLLAQIRECE
ncbi:MAG: hypothetical protein LWW83_06345 [Azonexaceae bacterium]|nr:hypothetical protein [Azonexaceae bacterium]